MFNILRLIFNVVCDLAAALFIAFGVFGLVWIFVLWVIFMDVPVMEVILLGVAVLFVAWRVIRFFRI